MSKCDVGGIIQGVVSEDGVLKVNSPVRLYDRDSGKLLKTTRTGDDGSFAFRGVDRESATYIVMATDEDGVAKKNALVYDRVQPINDTSGLGPWFQNWSTLVKGKEAILGYVPRAQQANGVGVDFPTQGYSFAGNSPFSYPITSTGFSSQYSADTSAFPGMPGLSAFQTRVCRLRFMYLPGTRQFGNYLHGPTRDNYGAMGRPNPCFTFEAAINLTTSSLNSIEHVASRATYNTDGAITSTTDANTTVSFQFICGTTRYLRVIADINGLAPNGMGINALSYVNQVFQLDITSLGTGWHHFVVVVDYSTGYIKVYVDGEPFNETYVSQIHGVSPADFMIGTPHETPYSQYGIPCSHFVQGPMAPAASGISPVNATFLLGSSTVYVDIGPFAMYEVELTPEEVNLHYRAMMTTSLAPLLSGYARRVVELGASRYWTFDGEPDQEWMPEVYGSRKTTGGLWLCGKSSSFVDGPIPGRKALQLGNPGHYFSEYAGVACNRLRSTFAVWVKRAAGKILPVFNLSGGLKFGSTAFTGLEHRLAINTSGQVYLTERLGTANYTWTVTSVVIPEDVWTHIAVLINSATLRLELYVNGAFAGEVAANSGTSSFRDSEPGSSRYIGKESAISVGTMAVNYRLTSGPSTYGGAMSDLAIFPTRLTAAEIQSLYDARLNP